MARADGVADHDGDDLSISATPPAEGERRAQIGYQGQYRVSANIIYRALRDGRLEAVRIADPDAGRVDDLQILTANRTDAFQVKWSEYPGSFTWNDLTKEEAAKDDEVKKPSLIAQLADGWKRLRSPDRGRRVVVHLVTNDLPSSAPQAKLPLGDPPPKQKHFAAFLEQAFFPAHRRGIDESPAIPSEWAHTWGELTGASGLSEGEFRDFVRDCVLTFGYSVPAYKAWNLADSPPEADDLREISRALPEFVVETDRVVEVSRERIIAMLGWQHRFEVRRGHEFPRPAFTYVPVEATRDDLLRKLDSLSGGYLAVVGPPGSGKSTLLTESLRARRERVVRYYAYVPDDPAAGRGEARNFLHDLVVQLENAGIRPGGKVVPSELTALAERLRSQIAELHRQWAAGGAMTIILVDRLDHVEREDHPVRSFLAELPLPDAVPDGVLILLGTQTEELAHLSPAVKCVIAEGDRRIDMGRLSRPEVFQVAARAGLPHPLNTRQLERVFQLTEGHPLALSYLLRSLSRAASPEVASSILASAEPYSGDIRGQYRTFWSRSVGNDAALRDILSLMACTRAAIDLGWALSWADESTLGRLRSLAYQYFREEGHRWYFHHSSFRDFLLVEAGKDPFGRRSDARLRSLHARLADLAGAAPSPAIRYDELHHRFHAAEHDKVLAIATQEHFRSQYFQSRPIWAIERDIELALRSAAASRDVVGLTRLLLSLKESRDRTTYLDDVPFPTYLLALGDSSAAVDHAREGLSLRISGVKALDLACKLEARGLDEEARVLFELASPSGLIGPEGFVVDENGGLEESTASHWARAAVLLRSVDEVVGAIRGFRFRNKFRDEVSDAARDRKKQNRILIDIAGELMDRGRWDDLERLAAAFDLSAPSDREAASWVRVHASHHSRSAAEAGRSDHHLEEALRLAEGLEMDDELRLALAIGSLLVLRNAGRASSLVAPVTTPSFAGLSVSADAEWYRFRRLFDLERVRYACGHRRPVEAVVPAEDADAFSGPAVALARDVVGLARLTARRRIQDETPSIDEVVSTVEGVIRRFDGADFDGARRVSWYSVLELRKHVMGLVVSVAQAFGAHAVDAVSGLFEVEWRRTQSPRIWPDTLKRSVLRDLYRAGVQRERIVAELDAIDARFFAWEEVYSRVVHSKDQVDAFLEVGEHGRARQALERLMRTSCGVGSRKDYQLNHWIDWLDRVFDLEPSAALGRASWFAKAVVSLRDSTERAHYRAAARLLEVVARRSPGWAIRLLAWFHEHGVLIHEEGVEILLREALTADRTLAAQLQPVLANCYLPISSNASRPILVSLFAELALLGDDRVLDAARSLAEAAKTFAVASSRQDWLRDLGDLLQEKGLDPAAAEVDVDRSNPSDGYSSEESWNTLVLGDGTKRARKDVIAHVHSAAELLDLIGREAAPDDDRVRDFSRFDWVPVIVSIADRLDVADLTTVAGIARSLGRDSPRALSALARRAAVLGQSAMAFQLGEDALRSGDPVGWATSTDGGTRLHAARTLVGLDAPRGRELAWKILETDISGGTPSWSWSWIAYELHELVEVLSEAPPLQELYREVEEHAHFIFSGVEFPGLAPTEVTEETRSEGWQVALGRLVEFQLVYPANWIAHGSQRCLVRLVLSESEIATNLVARLLAADGERQEVVLQVLESASLVRSEAVRPFEDAIRSLGSSPHLGIRRMATFVLRRLGISTSPRPAVDGLVLTERSEDADTGDASSFSIADSEAIEAIERLWGPLLRHIADSRGIAYASLVARFMHILKEMHTEGCLADGADEVRRGWIWGMGLRMAFRGSRYFALRNALSHLLAEMLDSGRLTPQTVDRIWPFLRYWDPAFLTIDPVPRPKFVGGMVHDPANPRRWAESASIAKLLPIELPDGWFLLAEETHLYIPAWERLREERVSQLAIEHCEPVEEPMFFATVTNQITSSYAVDDSELDLQSLVVRNVPHGQDSPGSRWIALNPVLADALGWEIDGSGLFRWVDAGGTLMAESRWWVDGPIETAPPDNDLVGEGFMVVVTREGLESIKAHYGRRLVRLERITRTIMDEGRPISEVRYATHTL